MPILVLTTKYKEIRSLKAEKVKLTKLLKDVYLISVNLSFKNVKESTVSTIFFGSGLFKNYREAWCLTTWLKTQEASSVKNYMQRTHSI